MNERDINAFQEAIDIFKQFKSIPVFEELNSMVLKLEGKILTDKDDKRRIIDFEKVENVKGIKLIKSLYEFIKNKQVIEIIYRPFNRDENLTMVIHPYLLKEFNNRWFLIGYNEELKKMSHLALDRIQTFIKTVISFKVSNEFDEDLYFNNILGITLPEKAQPELIELSFSPDRAPYIKTKPIHTSQKIIKEDEEGLTIQLKLVINKELISLLLSFGKDVKITKPESLKKEIQEILSDAIKKYE